MGCTASSSELNISILEKADEINVLVSNKDQKLQEAEIERKIIINLQLITKLSSQTSSLPPFVIREVLRSINICRICRPRSYSIVKKYAETTLTTVTQKAAGGGDYLQEQFALPHNSNEKSSPRIPRTPRDGKENNKHENCDEEGVCKPPTRTEKHNELDALKEDSNVSIVNHKDVDLLDKKFTLSTPPQNNKNNNNTDNNNNNNEKTVESDMMASDLKEPHLQKLKSMHSQYQKNDDFKKSPSETTMSDFGFYDLSVKPSLKTSNNIAVKVM
jgi:hypothetical protein